MEFLKPVLPWIEIVVSIVLVGLILLQRSGAELGGALGGGDGSGGTIYTRRGAEKVLFYLTIAFAIIFLGLAVLSLFLSKIPS
jgi:protein translocase SecG subunit